MTITQESSQAEETEILLTSYGKTEPFRISSQFIKLIGESLGLSGLSDDSINFASKSITFKLLNIINEAKKFCQKSNRNKMLTTDIDNVLIHKGYASFSLNNLMYNQHSISKLIGSGRSVGDIVYFNDEEVEIDDYLGEIKTKLKQPYSDTGLKAHWLAIGGVQPCIPENPILIDAETNNLKKTPSLRDERLPLSFHLQVYYKEITEASIGTIEEKRKEALASLQRDPSIKYLIVPLCSFIFQGIRVNIAAKNLAILIYIMRMVCSIIQNPAIPSDIMEHHFHEIVPAIISCILSPELCSKHFEENHWALRIYSAKLICNLCNNYEGVIPHLRGNIIELIKTSITSVLDSVNVDNDTFEMTSKDDKYDVLTFPFGTHFGAFYALSLMPLEFSKTHLIPITKKLGDFYEALKIQAAKTEHEPLQRDIRKTELQFLQLLLAILKKDGISDLSQMEPIIGKYFVEVIRQHQTTKIEQPNIKS
ncbi:hypothetical protein HZS_476 [Henneguya salminicola]|nr:hypothetical protein HZS_476 [Henneguya salminicola]